MHWKLRCSVWQSRGKVQVTTWPKLIYYKCNVLQCQGWKTSLMMVSVCSLIGLCFHTNLPWNLLTYSSNIIPKCLSNYFLFVLGLETSCYKKGTSEKLTVGLHQIIFQLTGDTIKDEPKYLRGLNSAQHTKRFRNIIVFKCILKCVLMHAVQVQCFYLH